MDGCQGPQQVCRIPAQIQRSNRFIREWFKYPTVISRQLPGSVLGRPLHPFIVWLDIQSKYDWIKLGKNGYDWIMLRGAPQAAPTSVAQSWLQMAFAAAVLVRWLGSPGVGFVKCVKGIEREENLCKGSLETENYPHEAPPDASHLGISQYSSRSWRVAKTMPRQSGQAARHLLQEFRCVSLKRLWRHGQHFGCRPSSLCEPGKSPRVARVTVSKKDRVPVYRSLLLWGRWQQTYEFSANAHVTRVATG